jgi:hypothetical protein
VVQVMYQNQQHHFLGTIMATIKPRITVTLTEQQHSVLKSISSAGGKSMSVVISELLEVSMPMLQRMASALEVIRFNTDEERARMVAAMDQAQAVIQPMAVAAQAEFDGVLSAMSAHGGQASSPRPVITGAMKSQRRSTAVRKTGKKGG